MQARTIQAKPPVRRQFPTRYTAEDAALLARVDAAHEELSGPAVKRILRREHEVFGHREYTRLAEISVSHLYNLRRSKAYRKVRVRVEHTRASQVSIGERRKPEPLGKPGYFRVDTVHQGHQDGRPGLFHINAVDTVTQWQVVGCVETISERHTYCRCWKRCCIRSRSSSAGCIATTGRSSSTIRSPDCWRN